MPRKNNQTYLAQRASVQRDWFDHGARSMSLLTTSEQRDLHDYFATTRDLSDEQVLIYRKQVSADDPSLPHRSGRAFVQLELATKRPELFERDGVATSKGRALVVYSVNNPNKDDRDRRLVSALTKFYFEPQMQALLDEQAERNGRSSFS